MIKELSASAAPAADGSPSLSQDRLREVLADWADLGENGLHCAHTGQRRPSCPSAVCGRPAAWFYTDRERLFETRSLARIAAVAELLASCQPTAAAGPRSPGSYGLKHIVERRLRSHPAVAGYVSNGEVIAASVVAGLPVRRDGEGSPNARIGIRRADVARLSA